VNFRASKGWYVNDKEIKARAAQKGRPASKPAYLIKIDGFVKFSYSDNAFNNY